MALGLNSVDPVLVMAAYDQLEETVQEKQSTIDQLKAQLKQKQIQLNTIRDNRTALAEFQKKYDNEKEQRDHDNRLLESKLFILGQKKTEYEKKLKDAASLVGDHISVQDIDALRLQYDGLLKQRNELRAQLDTFNELPADRTLARIKIAEAEHELQMLIDQRNNLLKARGH